MIENEAIMPGALGILTLALVFLYASKHNKNKTIAWLFTITGGLSILLFGAMLYNDLIIKENNWWKFNFFAIISFFVYIMVVFETFQKLPWPRK